MPNLIAPECNNLLLARRRERGVTLVVSLVFLLLLTILGITSIGTSTLQEKMAGNLRDMDMALQAAESALRDGEARLQALWGAAGGVEPIHDTDCTISGICSQGATDPANDTWWTANSVEYGVAGTREIDFASADPRSVIEKLQWVPMSQRVCEYGDCPGWFYYRITSRAVGTTPVSQSMLEETYRIRN